MFLFSAGKRSDMYLLKDQKDGNSKEKRKSSKKAKKTKKHSKHVVNYDHTSGSEGEGEQDSNFTLHTLITTNSW